MNATCQHIFNFFTAEQLLAINTTQVGNVHIYIERKACRVRVSCIYWC